MSDQTPKPTEDEINRLEKAAWDAGVDQALVYYRDKRDVAEGELRAVDMVLSGRSAFDDIDGRINKILAAINAASVADPKAESVRAVALQARTEAAEAAVATLTARCEVLEQENTEKQRQITRMEASDDEQILVLTSRCEALEKDAEWRRRWHDRLGRGDLTEGKFYEWCEALTAERDRLLAEKQADKDSFDRALAQFSAGYTQALDDALKGKP